MYTCKLSSAIIFNDGSCVNRWIEMAYITLYFVETIRGKPKGAPYLAASIYSSAIMCICNSTKYKSLQYANSLLVLLDEFIWYLM